MFSRRTVTIVVALTIVATLYSLSELHSLSAQHAAEDVQFVTHPTAATAQATTTQLSTKGQTSSQTASSFNKQTTASTTAAQTTISAQQKQQQTQSAVTSLSAGSRKCFQYPHTELWGDVVAWGTQNKADSAEDCCKQCVNYKAATAEDPDCNVWVWCGDEVKCKNQYRQCWLKHLAHPEASRPAKEGDDVPWTSGTLDVDITADPSHRKKEVVAKGDRRFHIVTSAQGSAVHWQARIHYYWYKKQKARCEKEGGCEMGGFTRLLHSGKPDDLMDEIPTMVVDPLPQDMVEHSWYVVLNRPYAFVQWCQRAKIPEKYVLMAEPDHVFLRPLPNFMTGEVPAAFPFFYIEPAKGDHAPITMKFTGKISRKQLEEIAPIGNSPTYMAIEDMKRTMPIWMNTSIAIFKDSEASQAWGWVQEMYGFTIACWLAGIKHVDLYLHMMAQPPWDAKLEMAPGKPFYILHYTYGMDYKLTGEFTPGKYGEWRFDKRGYSGKPLPRNLGEPPKGMKNDLVRALINSFNEATDAIPCWDKYAETGKVPATCDEAPKHFLAEEAKLKGKAL
mmetsp:Transcript_36561/g.92332  ORF Transcript_36561/g.92332 Transcript_36561/m.92332 type:complete len:560 (-) Transcript_36561:275-1954(-)